VSHCGRAVVHACTSGDVLAVEKTRSGRVARPHLLARWSQLRSDGGMFPGAWAEPRTLPTLRADSRRNRRRPTAPPGQRKRQCSGVTTRWEVEG
jgi:hypothetical protein